MKPPPTVHYAKRMPDIEQLMQVWPSDFEEYLKSNPMPDFAELDLPLKEFVKLIGCLLDVPMQGNALTRCTSSSRSLRSSRTIPISSLCRLGPQRAMRKDWILRLRIGTRGPYQRHSALTGARN